MDSRRMVAGALAAVIALTPLAGAAQAPKTPATDTVTTVSPLVSRPDKDPLGPIPDLEPQALSRAAEDAHGAAVAALGYACRLDYYEDEPGIDPGQLANAMLATEYRAQAQLQLAAQTA